MESQYSRQYPLKILLRRQKQRKQENTLQEEKTHFFLEDFTDRFQLNSSSPAANMRGTKSFGNSLCLSSPYLDVTREQDQDDKNKNKQERNKSLRNLKDKRFHDMSSQSKHDKRRKEQHQEQEQTETSIDQFSITSQEKKDLSYIEINKKLEMKCKNLEEEKKVWIKSLRNENHHLIKILDDTKRLKEELYYELKFLQEERKSNLNEEITKEKKKWNLISDSIEQNGTKEGIELTKKCRKLLSRYEKRQKEKYKILEKALIRTMKTFVLTGENTIKNQLESIEGEILEEGIERIRKDLKSFQSPIYLKKEVNNSES